MRSALLVGLVVVGLWGCESDGNGGDGDMTCDVTAPTACPDSMPTYDDVRPIFEEKCIVCHKDDSANSQCPTPGICWSLEDHTHITDWTPQIRAAMLDCSMPLRGYGVTMTNTEREEILGWLFCGAPE